MDPASPELCHNATDLCEHKCHSANYTAVVREEDGWIYPDSAVILRGNAANVGYYYYEPCFCDRLAGTVNNRSIVGLRQEFALEPYGQTTAALTVRSCGCL